VSAAARRGERAQRAAEAWDRWRWTNALLAFAEHATDGPVGTGGAHASAGPLGDVAVSVKDVFTVRGMVSRAGSLALDPAPADRDAVAVGRLRAAGAAIVAKGHCAEFAIGVTRTETRLGGSVLHPFDPHRSPGGSSGGDAVAVAAGVVDVALAGDYGGSVRWPAQAVGVYGLRTTAGMVPLDGRIPGAGATRADPTPGPPRRTTLQGQLEAVGLLARDPALLRRVLSVLAAQARPAEQAWPRVRLALTSSPEVGPLGADATAALGAVAAAAEALGWEVVDPGPVLAGAAESYATLRAGLDDLDDLRRLVSGREELLCADTLGALACAETTELCDTSALADARRTQAAVVARMTALFRSADALVLPVAAVGGTGGSDTVRVGGRWLDPAALMAHCRAVSVTGLPALSLPAVVGDDGRPVSVQIVGPSGADDRCCALGGALAAVLALPEPAAMGWGRSPGAGGARR
jgi:amidase